MHKSLNFIIYIAAYLINTVCFASSQEHNTNYGFHEETLVFTKSGPVQIQNIELGDEVLSCDSKNTCDYKTVQGVGVKAGNELVVITALGVDIGVSPDQLFFDANKKNWVKAKDFKVGDSLLNLDHEEVEIEALETANQEGLLYDLSIEDNHTFYVSKLGVLCHNFVVIVPFVYVIGQGVAWGAMAEAVAVTAAVVAAGYAGWRIHQDATMHHARIEGDDRNPAQDKMLTDHEIRIVENILKEDIHKTKGRTHVARWDLYKDKKGNVYQKPKGGRGPGEPVGVNLNDLR